MAVLSSWEYARLRVRQGKTGQRVRLGAVVEAGTAGQVFNDVFPWGLYARTSERMASPYFAYSNLPVPIPFEHDTAIAGAEGCTEPRFAWSPSRSITVVCNDGGTIQARRSDDDGHSFNSASSLFSSSSHPDISVSHDGMTLYAAWSSGALKIRRQAPGDATPAAAFDAEDAAGSPLVLEDTSFRIVAAPNGWWYLHTLLDSDTETTILQSYDDGESWAVTPGAVTGIATGTHPGICCSGADGTLYAYAYVGGEIQLTRRAPGDTAWSSPVVIEDENGDPIEVMDQTFSMAVAYEGPRRLILAVTLDGDDIPCELASSDDGISFILLPTT